MDYLSAVNWETKYNGSMLQEPIKLNDIPLMNSLRAEMVFSSFGLKMAMMLEVCLTILFWKAFASIWHDQIGAFLRSVAIPLTMATVTRCVDQVFYLINNKSNEICVMLDELFLLTSVMTFCAGVVIYSAYIYNSVDTNSHESGWIAFIIVSISCWLIGAGVTLTLAESLVMFSSILANTIISYSILVVPVFLYTLLVSIFPRNRTDSSADGLARRRTLNRSRLQILFILISSMLLYQSWMESTSRLLHFFSSSLRPWMMSHYYNALPWIFIKDGHYTLSFCETAIVNQLSFPVVFYLSIFMVMKQWRDAISGYTMTEETIDPFKFEATNGDPELMAQLGVMPPGVDPPPTYQEALQMGPQQSGQTNQVPPSPRPSHTSSNPPIPPPSTAAPPYSREDQPAPVYSPHPVQQIDPNWLHYNGLPPDYYLGNNRMDIHQHPPQVQRSTIFGQLVSQYPLIVDEGLDGLPGASPLPIHSPLSPLSSLPSTSSPPIQSHPLTEDFNQKMEMERLKRLNYPRQSSDLPSSSSISVRVMSAPVRRSPLDHHFKPLPTLKE